MAALLAAIAGVVLGLAAETQAFGFADARQWGPDLAVGWTFIACGLTAQRLRPESRTGVLLAATGFTWFAGNFARADSPWVAVPAAQALYLHRGVLIHCVLSFPTGRLGSVLGRVAVAVGYGTTLFAPLVTDELVGLGLVAVVAHKHATAVGMARHGRAQALRAAVAVGAVLAAGGLARLVLDERLATDALLLLLYQLALIAVAVGLLIALLGEARTAVTDLVVELTGARTATLREELARALGDPSIEVGYWLPAAEAYVDGRGQPFALPGPESTRAVTPIVLDGQPLGVLVHDPAVLDDPGLLEAITTATRLASANARLQAEVRAQVAEVEASRRRLVEAADRERRQLQERLRAGAQGRLAAAGEALDRARAEANRHPVTDATQARMEQADRQLHRTVEDVRELARGLHPPGLEEAGLAGALADLVRGRSIPIALRVRADGLPREVEAIAYFVCAEGLANVEKHAAASSASLTVVADAGLVVAVEDDGRGGADLSGGSGLRGLADRVEALGGQLTVRSSPGAGTRLTAEIPLGGAAR